MISFFVPGPPITKGSVGAWQHPKTKKIIRRDDHADELKAWASKVAWAANAAGVVLVKEGPVSLAATFLLERPEGHYSRAQAATDELLPSAPEFPVGRIGDIDKFARALLDALTGVNYRDDSQVVDLRLAKRYAPLGGAGVKVTVFGGVALREQGGESRG